MLNSLPVTIDPIRLADTETRLAGCLAVESMERLNALCIDNQAQVHVDLQFGRDAARRRHMHGTITATVDVVCQRCLHSMTVTLKLEPSLLLVAAEDTVSWAEEEYLVSTASLALSEVVEDELLLALPMISLHPVSQCQEANVSESFKKAAIEEKRHAFASLSTLIRTDK